MSGLLKFGPHLGALLTMSVTLIIQVQQHGSWQRLAAFPWWCRVLLCKTRDLKALCQGDGVFIALKCSDLRSLALGSQPHPGCSPFTVC
eukprot:1155701-Pelagomonas_calceolata.AAC.3